MPESLAKLLGEKSVAIVDQVFWGNHVARELARAGVRSLQFNNLDALEQIKQNGQLGAILIGVARMDQFHEPDVTRACQIAQEIQVPVVVLSSFSYGADEAAHKLDEAYKLDECGISVDIASGGSKTQKAMELLISGLQDMAKPSSEYASFRQTK